MSSVIIFILDLKFLFYHMSRQSSVLHVRICDQPRSVCQNTPSTMSSPPYPRYVPTSNPFLERFPCTTFFTLSITKKSILQISKYLWDGNYYIYVLYPKQSFKPCQFYQILLLITKVWNIYNNSVTYIHQCGRWTIGWLSIYYISLGNHV